jgi:hypothetical protein
MEFVLMQQFSQGPSTGGHATQHLACAGSSSITNSTGCTDSSQLYRAYRSRGAIYSSHLNGFWAMRCLLSSQLHQLQLAQQ